MDIRIIRTLRILAIALSLVSFSSNISTAQEYVNTPVEISKEKVRVDGKICYSHVVLEKQTLYSISKAYNVSIDDIYKFNPTVKETGLKKNSLFGTEVVQTQDSIENFCAKIRAGKKAQRTREFMICARIESLILEQGMEDALTRAFAFVEAGADAIMIHSRTKDPSEIQEFIEKFRAKDAATPIVLVPTSFNSVTEEEWKERGANIIIYANQLMRAEVPAMQKAAETILRNHRAEECDADLMPFKEIIRMIPEE